MDRPERAQLGRLRHELGQLSRPAAQSPFRCLQRASTLLQAVPTTQPPHACTNSGSATRLPPLHAGGVTVRSPSPSRRGIAWTRTWSLWRSCPQVRPFEVHVKSHGANWRCGPVCCRFSKPDDHAACKCACFSACCQRVQPIAAPPAPRCCADFC